MSEVGALHDPCPLPDQDKKSQSLNKKDSLLFAPLSNVGAVSFDKDAVYIDIGRVNYTKKENLDRRSAKAGEDDDDESGDESSSDESEAQYDADAPAGLLRDLQDLGAGVDEKMQKSSLRLFKGSKAVVAGSDDDDDDEEDDEEDDNDLEGARGDEDEDNSVSSGRIGVMSRRPNMMPMPLLASSVTCKILVPGLMKRCKSRPSAFSRAARPSWQGPTTTTTTKKTTKKTTMTWKGHEVMRMKIIV